MKQFTLLFILSILSLTSLKAQDQKGKISGTITDENGNPIPATITLKSQTDSTIQKITTTAAGKFFLNNLKIDKYQLLLNAVGYKNINENIEINSSKCHISKDYIMISISNNLGSVNIAAKKPLIERLHDKMVMNVENSIVSTGNNALEILAKIPGVSVNQDGIISVLGKSGVHVLIDGKSTYLSAAQLAVRLKSLSGNELKSIELMTSPSARYDASGNAGIINIKLKKNSSFGTNGNIDLGLGYGENPKSDAGISFNHNSKNFNIFGSFTNQNNKYQEDLNINRITPDGTSDLYFHQYNTQIRSSHNNNYKLGLDYFINERNTIGFLTSGYFNHGHDSSNGKTNIGKNLTQTDSSIVADNPSTNKYRNQTYNINYKSVIDTLGQEFAIDLDYAAYRSEEYTMYNNYFSDAKGLPYKPPLTFRNLTPSQIKIKVAKMDYTLPLSPKTKFDFGIKSSWVSTDNNFRFENLIASQWQNDQTRSNQFIYDENINAAYANFKHEFKSTSVEVGLRAEQTNSKGNSVE